MQNQLEIGPAIFSNDFQTHTNIHTVNYESFKKDERIFYKGGIFFFNNSDNGGCIFEEEEEESVICDVAAAAAHSQPQMMETLPK